MHDSQLPETAGLTSKHTPWQVLIDSPATRVSYHRQRRFLQGGIAAYSTIGNCQCINQFKLNIFQYATAMEGLPAS
jgi:hypothetical protein